MASNENFLLLVTALAKRYSHMAHNMAMTAATVRCAEMLSGSTYSTAAAIHVGNGGFSSLSSPFIVGTMMCWSYTISRAVTRLRTSMRSGLRDALPIMKIMAIVKMITMAGMCRETDSLVMFRFFSALWCS